MEPMELITKTMEPTTIQVLIQKTKVVGLKNHFHTTVPRDTMILSPMREAILKVSELSQKKHIIILELIVPTNKKRKVPIINMVVPSMATLTTIRLHLKSMVTHMVENSKVTVIHQFTVMDIIEHYTYVSMF